MRFVVYIIFLISNENWNKMFRWYHSDDEVDLIQRLHLSFLCSLVYLVRDDRNGRCGEIYFIWISRISSFMLDALIPLAYRDITSFSMKNPRLSCLGTSISSNWPLRSQGMYDCRTELCIDFLRIAAVAGIAAVFPRYRILPIAQMCIHFAIQHLLQHFGIQLIQKLTYIRFCLELA